MNFRVTSGGGSIFAGSGITDKNGVAQDYWTLGMTGTQTVEVRAVDPTTGAKETFATFTATFAAPPDPDADGDGYHVSQGDCNDADASIHPGAADDPDPNFIDNNCDGIDGDKSTAVLVSTGGADVASCGTQAAPCRTIIYGIQRAGALTRTKVFVSMGTYAEAVQIVNGVSLYGGYAADFSSRSLAQRATINGSAELDGVGSGQLYTVLADNVTAPTSVVAFVIQGAAAVGQLADGSGKNSHALVVRNVAAGIFTVSYSAINAGAGGAGAAGSAGTNASQVAAQGGFAGQPAGTSTAICDNVTKSLGGAGAVGGGLSSGNAGAGGDGGTADTDCGAFLLDFTARPGSGGGAAQVSGIGFGDGGVGGAGSTVCGAGQPGQDGRDGADGASGSGGSGVIIVAGFATANAGASGTVGTDGTSGGGGGGSGGCDVGTDSYGAGGGGGGGGGAKASAAGGAGKGGGSSIAIYLSAANPTLAYLDIVRGNGGAGGAGGSSGLGQSGGASGSGGAANGKSLAGGNGGHGGRGGNAGAGGGGAGGVSVGILKTNGSLTTETSVTISGGSGGAGGAGGSGGGGAGTAGALATTITP